MKMKPSYQRVAAIIGVTSVLIVGYDAVTYAAEGQSLLLGKANTSNAVTTVQRSTAGAAFALIVSNSSNSPFTTNGTGKVSNLYADRAATADNATLLGGLTLAQIQTAAKGATGPQGAQGAQGPKGDPGVAGAAGAVGAQGPKGDPGAAGAAGAVGAQGPQGLPGVDGVTGPQGPQGPAGANGVVRDCSATPYPGINLAACDLHVENVIVNMPGVNLISANLSAAMLYLVNFTGSTLAYASVRGAELSYVNFTGSDLTRADFSDSVMHNTNFTGANLFRANLAGRLDGANFTGANLTGANFDGAVLFNSPNTIYSNTTCPDGGNSDSKPGNTCFPSIGPGAGGIVGP
jgi:hypothetical protein